MVNLKQIPGLDQVREDEDEVHVGALTLLFRLMADPAIREREELACLHQALVQTATPQIRHMATVGGNLLQRPRCWYFRNRLTHCLRKAERGYRTSAPCFAFRGENKRHAILGGGPCHIVHPSDLAVALLALDASVVVVGPDGTRGAALTDFYLLPKQDPHHEVALAPNEVLTEVLIPAPAAGSRGVYVKVPERGARDFALVSVALQLAFSGKVVEKARVALGGVAPVPWRAAEAEKMMLGKALTDRVIERAAQAALSGARSLAQNAYKIDLARGLVRRALRSLR